VVELDCLPFGVGHTDEGVCLLLRLGPYRVLLDCGLKNIDAIMVKPGQPPADLVLCSHAHRDHAEGLLELRRRFPQLPIYASETTTQLLALNWPGIDAKFIHHICQALPWRTPVEFCEGLSAELIPAGHLPGASAFLLTLNTPQRAYTVLYTGDCFLSNSRLVEGFPLDELRGLRPDVLIVEGTYGTARHPRRRQQENRLAGRIITALDRGQSVLLPAPALGLGQELLMLLRSHHQFTGRDLDIWVDGDVAQGCDAYLEILPHLPTSVQNFAQHQPLFWDDRVRPRVHRLADRRQRFCRETSPCVVLTDLNSSLEQYQTPERQHWLVLRPQLNSWQAENSDLSDQVQSELYLLADHCDGMATAQLIHNLRPQHVIFVHGSPAYLADLTSMEELYSRYHLHLPQVGHRVELPIGQTFLQPLAPDRLYEGELAELESVVSLTLPQSLTADPRWRNFADTGLVEARWQGEELVLRGVPQWEMLNQTPDLARIRDRACCATCHYFRGQHCRNPVSPLYELKVTPDGFCPSYQKIEVSH